MRTNHNFQSGLSNPRILLAFTLCLAGAFLAAFSFAENQLGPSQTNSSAAPGNWSIVSSPNASMTGNNILNAVTCTSASDCWAVGYFSYTPPLVYQTLIEHWDGSSWTVANSANTSITQPNILYSVTCASASECWAVGYSTDFIGTSTVYRTLIERWDGISWTIVSSPNVTGNTYIYLNAVTCASASECWAVGDYAAGSAGQTLIERWDGSSWTIVSSPPNTSADAYNLFGVTCESASDCWAVGQTYTGGKFGTLIEHWDGNSWNLVSSPNGDSTYMQNFLYSVACASATECWGAGYYNTFYGQELFERWDGNSWKIVNPLNNNPALNYQLESITCTSASECWAAGYISSLSGPRQTLIERWDGSSWSTVTSPNPGSGGGFLTSVTCASAWECWAVGFSGGSGNGLPAQTLIEHYTAPRLLSVVSRKEHSNAGTFDVDLPLTGVPGIECRTGGGTGSFTMVFTFTDNLVAVSSANVSSGTGSVSSRSIGPNPNQYSVNLTGVTNAEYITVTVNGVLESTGVSGTVSARMGVLVGDVNASGVVTSGDTNLCKGQALQPVTSANFRNDVNASGSITTGDVNIIKQNALSQLPTPP